MSWNPLLEPAYPDAVSLDAIETLIVPRAVAFCRPPYDYPARHQAALNSRWVASDGHSRIRRGALLLGNAFADLIGLPPWP